MKIRDAIYLLLNRFTNLMFYEEVQLASAVTVAANSTIRFNAFGTLKGVLSCG